MTRPSTVELECFVCVAEQLSFSRAARRLHLSQPPLSRHVQSLEKKLGVRLLERSTRIVSLTVAGTLYLEDARQILTRLDGAAEAVCRAAIVLVMDQLTTHNTASLYEAFAPTEARRLAKRLEIHHTPKPGSWLNLAEIELSVLARQCLERRSPSQEALAAEVAVWQRERNAAQTRTDWRFFTEDARIKLHRLYPSTHA